MVCRHGDLQRAGVGKPHVFAGKARHSARDVEGVFARLEHTRQPIYRGIRVGVAHRFVQGRDDVVVFLARLVVKEGFLGSALFERFGADRDGAVVCNVAVEHSHLEGGKRRARVTVGKCGDGFYELIRDVHDLIAESAGVCDGTVEQFLQVVYGKRLQYEHFAARKQCAVDLE